MEQIFAFFTQTYLGLFTALFVPIFGFFYKTYNKASVDPNSLKRIGGWLEKPSSSALYHANLSIILDWLDSKLRPQNIDEIPMPEKGFWLKLDWSSDLHASSSENADALSRHPMGWPLLDFCLKFAIIYPVWILLASSLVFQIDARIGSIIILENTAPLWIKIGFSYIFIAALIGNFFLSNRWKRLIQFSVLFVAFAFAFAFAGAVAVAFAGAFAGAFAVAGAGAVAVAVAVAFAVAGAVAFAFAGAGAFAFAGAVAVAFAIMVLLAFMIRKQRPIIGFCVYYCALIGAILGVTAFFQPSNLNQREVVSSFIFFFAVLPLINALFDYISLGFTRHLLRQGVTNTKNAIWYGICDLAAAALIFTALGSTLIGFIHLLNSIATQPLLQFEPFFIGLKDPSRWKEHIWIYAMIFTTFVPTAIHFSIATFSLVAHTPQRLKIWILSGITGDEISKAFGVLTLSAIVSFLIVFPIWSIIVLLKMLATYYPIIGSTYLSWFECFARMIGAF